MKLKVSFLVFLILPGFLLRAQEKYPVPWKYANTSFTDFVRIAEANLPVRFFYRDDWVSDLVVADYKPCKDLVCILDKLFSGSNLSYIIDVSGNIVITKNVAVSTKLAERKQGKTVMNAAYADSVEKQQKTEVLYLEIGRKADAGLPGNVIVSGYVTDIQTREQLPGVTVFIQDVNSGTVTNSHGYYSVSLRRGRHLFRFRFIGMRETIVNLQLNGPGEMNINMKSIMIPLKETVISAERNVVLQRYETGVEKINVPSLKMLPAFLGEADIIKSLLLVTGVQSVGEGAAGFNVRGGSSDQNLMLLNGATIYNSSHFFGFFSAINSDIIKDVTLYKGGIPARYGGRISSVLDIITRDGNMQKFAGNAGISPITAHLTVEGPVIRDTLSYLISGRATYSDWLLGLLKDKSLRNSSASFLDISGKLAWSLNRNNKFDLSAYVSRDMFAFSTNTVYNYDNMAFSLGWKHFYNTRFFSLLTISNSDYRFDIHQNAIPGEEYVLTHQLNTTGLKYDFNFFRGLHELNFGIDGNFHYLLPGSYLPGSDSSVVARNMMDDERALEAAVYIDEKIRLTDYLSAEAGFRFSSYFAFGPGTVYSYDPGYTKSPSTITGERQYTGGQLMNKYGGPEFRASLNLRITGNNSFKINYNRTRQYIHLLSNSTTISPTDTWKLCDTYLKPETGDQYAVGFYQMLFGRKLEASVDVYYKDIRNMIDFKGGTALSLVHNIEQDIINVRGRAYGLEISIKKTEGRTRYNIGYTYARTFARSISEFRDETVNDGNWYPANFDRPHDLVITLQHLYSRRLSLSANYTYTSGRPVTYPVSHYWFNDILLIHYSDRNKYRIPYYSRLDLSLKINGKLKLHRIAHPYWTVSVYNALARSNAYSVYFVRRYEKIKGYKLSVFGTAIPSVAFGFDF